MEQHMSFQFDYNALIIWALSEKRVAQTPVINHHFPTEMAGGIPYPPAIKHGLPEIPPF